MSLIKSSDKLVLKQGRTPKNGWGKKEEASISFWRLFKYQDKQLWELEEEEEP